MDDDSGAGERRPTDSAATADDAPSTDDAASSDDRLRERIDDQFSYRSERADVWRAFDLLLPTDAFLNLGYSGRFQSHVLGSPQRRLATVVGRRLVDHLATERTRGATTDAARVLDVGCGRGGPSVHLAEHFGLRVLGVDLVPYNVARGRKRAIRSASERSAAHSADAEFVVGDATQLPVASDSLGGAVSVDALVYLPEREAVFEELASVLEPGGAFVLTDLFARPEPRDAERQRLDAFADAWDMPRLGTVSEYERALADAGLEVVAIEDLTAHSVGRFRKWTTLFGWLRRSPAGRLLDWSLRRFGLDTAAIAEQVRQAHDALPSLRHALVVARVPGQ